MWHVALILAALQAAGPEEIRSLVAKIEASASLETPALAVDTRIRAAERLSTTHPALAKQVLDDGIPALRLLKPPAHATYRFLTAYCRIDPDGAERTGRDLPDRDWSHMALITSSVESGDFARAGRLVRSALAEGRFRLGAITLALSAMRAAQPPQAATLLKEVVAAFRDDRATARDVQSLYWHMAALPDVEPALAREATRRAFRALDRLAGADTAESYEETAEYRIRGPLGTVKAETTYETALVPAILYLSVYDFAGWHQRASSLPAWRIRVPRLTPKELSVIVRSARRLRVQKKPARVSQDTLPDYRQMQIEAARIAMRSLPDDDRPWYLRSLLSRDGISAEQRRAILADMLEAMPIVTPDPNRFQLARSMFADAVTEGTGLEPVLRSFVETIKACADSGDERFGGRETDFHSALLMIGDEAEKRGVKLEEPSIDSRRLLRQLDPLILRAVDFTLSDAEGLPHRLSDLRGKTVVLDFWATWCGPCREALPVLEKIHKEWSSKGVIVLGVDDEPAEAVRRFSPGKMSYPTLIDAGRKVHNLFGVGGIPATFIIGRNGHVIGRVPYPHTEENLIAALRKAGVN